MESAEVNLGKYAKNDINSTVYRKIASLILDEIFFYLPNPLSLTMVL
jgi:hypothetical protein